eukprot:CAMPEP_0119553956 /NCGR_PEP_ID=MMETSP1352-20130426/6561_1 /TAXON_ID=265584 /ORGANISM="Stauroneis constricta, Strain CCMP1120" /LENGTH=924 /DNA_ID=CAMNT_0007600449 /DNA_START=70 /DNA_END=2844 /DNA_ORIENTATION=+
MVFGGSNEDGSPKQRISLDNEFRLNAPEADDFSDDGDQGSSLNLGGNESSSDKNWLTSSINTAAQSTASGGGRSVPRSSFQWIGDDLENPSGKGPMMFGNSKQKSSLRKSAYQSPSSPLHSGASNSKHGNSSNNVSFSSTTNPPNNPTANHNDKNRTNTNSNTTNPQLSGATAAASSSNNGLNNNNASNATKQQIEQQLQSSQQIVAQAKKRSKLRKCMIITGITVIVVTFAILIAAIIVLTTDNDDKSSSNSSTTSSPTASNNIRITDSPTLSPTNPFISLNSKTLQSIYSKQTIRCGIQIGFGFAELNETTNEYYGIDIDLCHALAAAIFADGNPQDHVEFVILNSFNRFVPLRDEDIDVLFSKTTHTMQRHVLEPTSGVSLTFSVPYIYDRLHLAGLPEFVECVDTLVLASRESSNETTPLPTNCNNMKICVLEGGTHATILKSIVPENIPIASVLFQNQLYDRFIDGNCNLIAGEQYDIAETILVNRGYDGLYEVTTQSLSQEPLCMVTRSDDMVFSDLVNWILQALFTAEDNGITKATAALMGTTDIFGPNSDSVFQDAVAAVGNYGEIFERNLQTIAPRAAVNTLNQGDTGLIFPLPFGDLSTLGEELSRFDLLRIVQERGVLRCGVTERPFFANEDNGVWSGFDVDFCRALAAALFGGDATKVEFTDLNTSNRFTALKNREVDVLARLTTHTLERDLNEPRTNTGLTFSQPIFYDGLTFGGVPAFVQCADDRDITSVSCRSLKICVTKDTTFESQLMDLFDADFMISRDSIQDAVLGLEDNDCNVIAGGNVDVYEPAVRDNGFTRLYRIGTKRFSRDPLALVTIEDDLLWSRFVYWVTMSTFYAETKGITMMTADQMPVVNVFGPTFTNMFKFAIAAVGSYGEIFERNGGEFLPRDGQNGLNQFLSSPQILPLPGIL